MSQNPNLAPYPPSPGYGQPQQVAKSFLVTWLLSLLLGVWGIDRFYLGKDKGLIVRFDPKTEKFTSFPLAPISLGPCIGT